MITAKQYFKQNEQNAGQCFECPVIIVSRVAAGDTIFVNNFGLPLHTVAENYGWHLEEDDIFSFVSEEDFVELKKKLIKVDLNEFNKAGKIDLPSDAQVDKIIKGQAIVTYPFGEDSIGVQSTAKSDGFLLTIPDKFMNRFFSPLDFYTRFNSDQDFKNINAFLCRNPFKREINLVKYIALTQNVTLNFQDGVYDAKAGQVLRENSDDLDGYTVGDAITFERSFFVSRRANIMSSSQSAKPKRRTQKPTL